jgi:hypothetical protein
MQPKNKNKHIAKLKFLKIGDQPKDSDHESVEMDDVSIQRQIDSMVTHDNIMPVSPESEGRDSTFIKTANFQQSKKFEKPVSNHQEKVASFQKEFTAPSFLQRVFSNKTENKQTPEVEVMSEQEIKMLPFSQYKADSNPNSFSSIFNKDHQEVFGIQRVFRKSIIFLILHLLSFGLLAFVGLNVFTLPLVFSVLIAISYVVITNIFYIIVADRSYVWLSLVGQAVLILITHAFVGLSFGRVTLVFTILVSLFTYFAYSELEKVQLSSRLFSISHITTESIRILITVIILVLSLGVFNKALSQGSENYVSEAFLDKSFILKNVVVGRYKTLSLNRYIMKGRFYIDGASVKSDLVKPSTGATFVFADFLTQNYRPSEAVLTEEKKNEILSGCDKKTVKNCDTLLVQERQVNLENWRKEAYSSLPYTIDTELTPARFELISKEYYINEVKKLNSDNANQAGSDITDTLSKYLIVPRSYIIPAFVALVLFILLTIIKPLLQLIVFWFTFVIWNILVWAGFAKINIEKVEAEIVSI